MANIVSILNKIDEFNELSKIDIINLLSAKGSDIEKLYKKADALRAQYMGNDVYLRGIIEFSNYCTKNCNYCGIRKSNKKTNRYRISNTEIVDACHKLKEVGQTTVVLQSGEDPFYSTNKISQLLKLIKRETNLAITLSVGVQAKDVYNQWQEAGMDRYLLRFESSSKKIFELCHPDETLKRRVKALMDLKELKVQTGSGFLIGIPNESLEDLANDLLFTQSLNLDMIGVGPFIPGPGTPFADRNNPFDPDICFKTIAVLRLLNKKSHIPSTTAFDVIHPNGRNLLLERGCNVFMPNATPKKYRVDYQLYPGKPCVDESTDDCASGVINRIKSIGRELGTGPGHSILYQ